MKTPGINVNIGCGDCPTTGWHNFDGSWSVRMANLGPIAKVLFKLGIILSEQYKFVEFARQQKIIYSDATKRIPFISLSL